MTALLARLLGRMPVGWLQLTHNYGRLASAVAGVAFANVLVFVQLGIMGSMNTATRDTYKMLNADIILSAKDANTISEGSNVPRQWMFRAMSDPGVADATPLYMGSVQWKQNGNDTKLQLLAMDPVKTGFFSPQVRHKIVSLTLPDVAMIDLKTRQIDQQVLAGIRPHSPLTTEIMGHTISFADTFTGGVGFSADGYVLTSDQTFLRLFPQRQSGAPNHILLKLAPGHDAAAVIDRLRADLPSDLRIRTIAQAADDDVVFSTTKRPTGIIFGFGVLMGVLVGIVIVYQVLSTDVADHLKEYATFKAMGYAPGFFLGIIFEEAMILALLGFVPGSLVSWGVHSLLRTATGLPINMDGTVVFLVFLGTLAACAVSGAVATRRLNAADPADLF
ncbi:FtsX-like permease family protein [Sedimentitalea sp. JM2-8]|uniref:FtsX-like permease family protein n=1 Tax=Sedimentitalea xiamensis TaxID=3050037 RepID=A0ABT7FFS7_9RHOB|nr:FtsX-like permease family protein [Sedimentitalea xiamensis]MDK3073679.1 FtsX-like permease family protein [Sedimentitalea xiamensis]